MRHYKLKQIEQELDLLRHQLKTYNGYVSSADIKDGYYTGEDISKRIFELEKERSRLLRESA